MRLRSPKRNAVYVTATDAETRKSKSLTLYETTPEAVIASIEDLARQTEENSDRSEQDAAPASSPSGA